MSTDFAYTKGDLFLPGPNRHYNACVGRNGGPYDYFAYATGYFRAAEHVIRTVINGEPYLDLIVYPTIYLYRHAFELALKDLSRKLLVLHEEDRDFSKTHRLSTLWSEVEKRLRAHPNVFEKQSIDGMGDLIADLDQLDTTAEVFRFPESRRGERHLEDRSLINYGRLKSLADAENVFRTWVYAVESLGEYGED